MEFFTDENFVIDKSDIINHVRVITKDPNMLDEFIKRYMSKSITKDGNESICLDFDKIYPMPNELLYGNERCNPALTPYLYAYLYAICPSTPDYGYKKVSDNSYAYILNKCITHDAKIASVLVALDRSSFNMALEIDPSYVKLGEQYFYNLKKYNAYNWYDWRLHNWGSVSRAHFGYTTQIASNMLFISFITSDPELKGYGGNYTLIEKIYNESSLIQGILYNFASQDLMIAGSYKLSIFDERIKFPKYGSDEAKQLAESLIDKRFWRHDTSNTL